MLVIDNLSVRIAGRLLLDGASARIPDGARVGLVGRNGAGKTTLFRVITGDVATEQGHVDRPSRATLGHLAQEAPSGDQSLIAFVLAANLERTRLLAEAEVATDPHRIADIQTRLADMGAHAAPARAAGILAGLGFSHADQERPIADFSGGWRMRLALAATLFAEPDLLLLDEPTNFLDLEGTLWLESHLARYPHTILVISHDRDLLDSVVEWILHLEGGKLTLYRGGYSSFARQRSERQMLDLKLAKKQDAHRKRLTAFVERFRAKATKARQAQSRLKQLAKLEPIAAVIADDVRPIEFPAPQKPLSPPIIALEGVSVGYEPGRPILSHLDLRIDDDDRIALVGANGNGKSTLVKLLAGRLPPMSGRVTRAERIEVAYFAQHQLDELVPDDSVYQHVRRLMPDAPEAKVRARAGSIGFSGQAADTAVKALSGGEKARLLLGLATFHGPHLIILDEPTNHLDIDSRAALVEGINTYPGAVILVSHDRHLLAACADRLWLVADGRVTPFDGDIDDYQRLVLSDRGGATRTSRDREADTDRPNRAEVRRAAAERRAELAPLRQRINKTEAAIARLSREISDIDTALAEPGLFTRDAARAAALGKSRAAAARELARFEDEWLEASTAYDAANA